MTTLEFCREGYVRVCAVVENEGAFYNNKILYVKVVATKGHCVAKAILGKNGAQQPHSIVVGLSAHAPPPSRRSMDHCSPKLVNTL